MPSKKRVQKIDIVTLIERLAPRITNNHRFSRSIVKIEPTLVVYKYLLLSNICLDIIITL